MTTFQWISFFSILSVALAGGYYPLFGRTREKGKGVFSAGEAFTAGVFMALSLIIMFPTAAHLFSKTFPNVNYPLASVCAIFSFLILLGVEHSAKNMNISARKDGTASSSPVVPILMTIMIAIPSFLLGTALGVSKSMGAVFVFIAVLTHKGSAGFGLALTMVRSTLKRRHILLLYAFFALSTPVGILVGADMQKYIKGDIIILVKACILSLASGVFLYMSTLHDMEEASLVKHCSRVKGFSFMLAGLIITALVRLALGFAHGG